MATTLKERYDAAKYPKGYEAEKSPKSKRHSTRWSADDLNAQADFNQGLSSNLFGLAALGCLGVGLFVLTKK